MQMHENGTSENEIFYGSHSKMITFLNGMMVGIKHVQPEPTFYSITITPPSKQE